MKDKKNKDKSNKNKKRKDKKDKTKKSKDKTKKSKDKTKKSKGASKKELGKKKDKSQRTKAQAAQVQASDAGRPEAPEMPVAMVQLSDEAVVSQLASPAPPRAEPNIRSGDDNAAGPTDRAATETASGKKPHYHVFLSHNSRDKPAVEPLAVMLRQKGLNPFLDKWNLIPGQPVDEALVDALEHSDSAVIFVGPDGDGPWQSEEMRDILKRAVKSQNEFRAIPVLLPGASAAALEKSFLGSRLWIEFKDVDDDDALLRLAKAVQGEAYGDESFKLPDEPAPYRGLERFERIKNLEEDFFFGRDDEIRALVDRLMKDRFVAVVGASGSGKSSLIRAGLTKQLAEEIEPGIRRWQTLIVEPGSRPFRSLAVQVAVAAGIPAAERERWIEDRVQQWSEVPDGVRTSIETLFADATEPLLVFIDQFEELFTHRKEGEEHERIARNFVANLTDIWKNGGNRVRVILALRADFVERCLEIGPLKELLQDRTMLVGEVGDDALREIVKEPAARVGAFLEKGLMERILKEVRSQSGSLPLLQQALHELWKHRKGAWLTHEAFDASGGVARALNDQAQAAYKSLDDQQRKIADGLFPRLITLGEGVSDTRRRVKRKELYPEGVEPAAVNEVIDKLSSKDARILVTSREGGDLEDLAAGEDFVEFTHEALLGNWEHLVTLLDSERASIRKHRVLTTMAQDWEAKPPEERHKFLLRAGQLVIAEQWATVDGGYAQLNQVERNFLDESIRQRQAEEAHQAKIARRLKMLSIGATAAAVVAVAVSIYAFDQQGKAEVARALAETNRGMGRELMADLVPELTQADSFDPEDKIAMAKSAVKYFEKFVEEQTDDDTSLAVLADAQYSIGKIHYDMEEFDDAILKFRKAFDLQCQELNLPIPSDEFGPKLLEDLSVAGNEGLANDLGFTLNALGHAFRRQGFQFESEGNKEKADGHRGIAKAYYSGAAAVREELQDLQPNRIDYRLLHASALMNVGITEKNLGLESARRQLEKAADLLPPASKLEQSSNSVSEPSINWLWALYKHNLADIVRADLSKGIPKEVPEEDSPADETTALDPMTLESEAIALYEGLPQDDFGILAELAVCYQNRGQLRLEAIQGDDKTETPYDLSDPDFLAAIADYERAEGKFKRLSDNQTWVVWYRTRLTDVSLKLKDLHQVKLDVEHDKDTLTKVRRFWTSINSNNRRNLETEVNDLKLLQHFGISSIESAAISTELKEFRSAQEQLDEDIEFLREFVTIPELPADNLTVAKFNLAKLTSWNAKVCSNLKEADAAKLSRQADELWGELIKANPVNRAGLDKQRKSLEEKYKEAAGEDSVSP